MLRNIIKIILAILFFVCLSDMPYGYFQLVRFFALIGFVYLAYQAKQTGNQTSLFIYIGLAALFQPFIKISFGREIWNIIDVVTAILLLASIFIKPKSSN